MLFHTVAQILADGSSGTTTIDLTNPSTWFQALLSWGPPGVVVVLFLTGWIEPKRARLDLLKEKNNWQVAFTQEQEAHQKTREALAKAEERADIALENTRALNYILQGLGHGVPIRDIENRVRVERNEREDR